MWKEESHGEGSECRTTCVLPVHQIPVQACPVESQPPGFSSDKAGGKMGGQKEGGKNDVEQENQGIIRKRE